MMLFIGCVLAPLSEVWSASDRRPSVARRKRNENQRDKALGAKNEENKKQVIQDRLLGEIKPLVPPSPSWTKVEYAIERGLIEEIILDGGTRNLELYVCQAESSVQEGTIKMNIIYKVDPFKAANTNEETERVRSSKSHTRRTFRRKKEDAPKENVTAVSANDIDSLENVGFLADNGRILSFKNLKDLGDKNFPLRINLFLPFGVQFSPYSRSIFLRGDLKPMEELEETTVVPQGTTVRHQEAVTAKTSKKKSFFGIF